MTAVKKPLIAILPGAVALAALWLILRPEPKPPPPASAPTSQRDQGSAAPAAQVHSGPITTLAVAQSARSLNAAETRIEDDFSTLQLLLGQYRQHLKAGNPVGDNAEITAALLGNNPKGLAYLPASGPFLDAQGRLIDRWGTPYFFHALSGSHMEIQSAGPDRQHHTDDDLRSEF